MRDDRGQSSIEWLGVALIVVTILGALASTELGAAVPRAFASMVCTATGGGCATAGEEGTGAARSGTADDGALSADDLAALADVLVDGDPAAVRAALDALDDAPVAQALDALTDLLALTDGVPQDIRVRANAARIAAEIERMQADLALVDPDDDGGVLGAIEDFIDDNVPLVGDGVPDTDAERAALLQSRIDLLQGWLDDGRQIIAFEPPTTPWGSDAVIVEVFGDLDTATHIGIIVPGITNDMDSYDAGLATSTRAIAEATGGDTALVAHLGYDTPDSLTDAATRTGQRAREAAGDLAGFIDALDADGRDRDVTLVGHSYGSRVAAEAVQQSQDVDRVVILGSPGTGVETAADLGLDPDDVYVGRNADDPIRHVGTVEGVVQQTGIDPGDLGHGRDPVDDGYGGQLLEGPPTGGHSGYFDPLDGIGVSVTAIIDGRPDDADVAADRGGGTPR